MYYPGLGRFSTRDPIEYDAGDANLYRYVRNSPVTRVDPLGLGEFDLAKTVQLLDSDDYWTRVAARRALEKVEPTSKFLDSLASYLYKDTTTLEQETGINYVLRELVPEFWSSRVFYGFGEKKCPPVPGAVEWEDDASRMLTAAIWADEAVNDALRQIDAAIAGKFGRLGPHIRKRLDLMGTPKVKTSADELSPVVQSALFKSAEEYPDAELTFRVWLYYSGSSGGGIWAGVVQGEYRVYCGDGQGEPISQGVLRSRAEVERVK